MNKKILASGIVITFTGVVVSWQQNKPITRIIMGGYIFTLVLALLDMFGGEMSIFAGALAMLAMLYVLLTEFPWATLIQAARG